MKKQLIIVVLIGVLIVINYFSYQNSKETRNLVAVPYAKKTINSLEKIENDMLGLIEIDSSLIDDRIYMEKEEIINNYVKFNSSIPQGSFIYKESIISLEQRVDKATLELKNNQVVYPISVNVLKSSGKSIVPNQVVDLYGTIKVDKETYFSDKLVENIRVLAVKDRLGNNVFDKDLEKRTPALILLAIDEQLVGYLNMLQNKGSLEILATYKSYYDNLDESILNSNSDLLKYLR